MSDLIERRAAIDAVEKESHCYVQKEGFFSDVPFEYKVVAWMPLPEPWKGE